jgi:AcrR family transcriptional regulator
MTSAPGNGIEPASAFMGEFLAHVDRIDRPVEDWWTVLVTTTAGDRRLTSAGQERRQQLLDAAADLFSSEGFATTRVSDICDAAGVAKGLFYWYFASKDALIADLVRTMRQRLRRAQAAAMDPTAPALTQLRQGSEGSIDFMARHRAWFALLDMEGSDPVLAAAAHEGAAVYVADVERLIRRGQLDGSVVQGDPYLLAIGTVGTVGVFARARRSGQLDSDDTALARAVGDWVERALGRVPDTRPL